MKGLDLHREFFRECGRPLLERAFPHELPLLAVASVGFGSDRFGADDEYSRDHGWGPGLQIFSDHVQAARLKEIEAFLHAELPWEFRGFRRDDCLGSPHTIRAWTVDEFFASMAGYAHPPERDGDWLLIADEALAHVTNGEVFHDPEGAFTRRREAFAAFPENVRRFKLAGRARRIDVERYRATRCAAHGEEVAGTLALWAGVREVLHFACLANRRYAPHDRWLPWVFRGLPELSGDLAPDVERLIAAPDLEQRLTIYVTIVERCAAWTRDRGLVPREGCWWADLRRGIEGELADFPVQSWVGVEYGYGSQFALGGDFRTLLDPPPPPMDPSV